MNDADETNQPNQVDRQIDRVSGDGPAAIGILILTILFIVLIVVFVV